MFGELIIIIVDNIYFLIVLQLDVSFVKGLCLCDGSEQVYGVIIVCVVGIVWLSQQGEVLNSVQFGEIIVFDMCYQCFICD